MKKKVIYVFLFFVLIMLSVFNLVLNILFLSVIKTNDNILDLCQASVVEIKAETKNIGTSYGTGEIISSNGTIITNAHVISYTKLSEIILFETTYIRFIDEDSYRQVEIVKFDKDLDVAILKLNATDRHISSIKIGNDDELSAGDTIYALGNMSNYGLSLTKGIVSIPHINVSYNNVIRNVIQCDLTISDGNSGGALINSKGELVGITTFRLKDNSNNIIYGVAYCIPINVVMEYVLSN